MATDSEAPKDTLAADSTQAELANNASNMTITTDEGERAAKRIKMDEPAPSSESARLATDAPAGEDRVKPTGGQAPRVETRKGLAPIKKE